jgi:hypothetical protein
MPWPIEGAPKGNRTFAQRHNHSLSGPAAAKAGDIANAVLEDSGDEGKAARIANFQVGRMLRKGTISNAAHDKAKARVKKMPPARPKNGIDGDHDLDASTR